MEICGLLQAIMLLQNLDLNFFMGVTFSMNLGMYVWRFPVNAFQKWKSSQFLGFFGAVLRQKGALRSFRSLQ